MVAEHSMTQAIMQPGIEATKAAIMELKRGRKHGQQYQTNAYRTKIRLSSTEVANI